MRDVRPAGLLRQQKPGSARRGAARHHVARDRRRGPTTGLEEIEALPGDGDPAATVDAARTRDRLHALIGQLAPPDRSVILLYLEGSPPPPFPR